MGVYKCQWYNYVFAVTEEVKKDLSSVPNSSRGKICLEIVVLPQSFDSKNLLWDYNPSLLPQTFSTITWIDCNFNPDDDDCEWLLGTEGLFLDLGDRKRLRASGYDIFLFDPLENKLRKFLSFRVRLGGWFYRGGLESDEFKQLLQLAAKTSVEFLLSYMVAYNKYLVYDSNKELPKGINDILEKDDNLSISPWCILYRSED